MKEFETVYPPDRGTQLRYLVEKGWVSTAAVELLNKLAAAYGCIAKDLGMFPTEGMDTVLLTWNVPIADIREGGRKRNSLIAQMVLSPEGIVFQNGEANSPQIAVKWGCDDLDNIIERYRTCRG